MPTTPKTRRNRTPFWNRWPFWATVALTILTVASAATSGAPQQRPEHFSPSTVTTESATAAPSAPETGAARMPSVEGESVFIALPRLAHRGIQAGVEPKLTNSAPEGIVLRQSERAGSRVDPNDWITLIVAKALPKIPNVVGRTLTNAKRTLERYRFEVAMVTQQTSSQPKGTVISQSPAARTSVRPGEPVSLVVAKRGRATRASRMKAM